MPISFHKGIYFKTIFLTTSSLPGCSSKSVSKHCAHRCLLITHQLRSFCVIKREVGPTGFQNSTMSFFLLGGTICPGFLCTRWLSPKGPKLLGSLGFQMCLLLSIWGNATIALFLPSMCSAVRLYSDMLFGRLLIDLIVFIFNFESSK